MRFCDSCGAHLAEGDGFCTQCGSQQPPLPAEPETPAVASATAGRKLPRWVIATIVAVAVVLAGCGIAYGTYSAELWGGKTVEDPFSWSDSASEITTDDVVKNLENKGFSVEVQLEFSSHKAGTYLRMEDAEIGQRRSADRPIVVVGSKGPGVPDNTVGLDSSAALKAVKDMGVPVSTQEVVVSDSTVKKGTVVASIPADGSAVEDLDTGIVFAVAGDPLAIGIGVDLVGQPIDSVKKTLKGAAINVELKPKFSSKQYVGKMVTSSPAPGSTMKSGETATIYYGVDASDVQEVFTAEGDILKTAGDEMAGDYCKADGSDCISFEMFDGEYGSYLRSAKSEGVSNSQLWMSDMVQSVDYAPTESPNSNRLIDKANPVIELAPYESLVTAKCGSETRSLNGAGLPACIGGKLVDFDKAQKLIEGGATEEFTYEMDDFYLYFPVGADIEAVEETGYFDADELAKAKKQESVDTSRPFILVRDPSLYSTTSVSNLEYERSPFTFPMLADGGKSLADGKAPMKPAVSHETVYYLDESSYENAWYTGADGDGSGESSSDSSSDSSGGSSKDSSDSSTKKAAAKSWSDVRKSLASGDFSDIAGRYCLDDGSDCVSLAADGTLTGENGSLPNGKSPVSWHLDSSDMGWGPTLSDEYGAYLNGPEDAYGCKDTAGYDAYLSCDMMANSHTPANAFYIPAGTSSENLDGIAAASWSMVEGQERPDESRAYLFFPYKLRNDPPLNSTVYYLVD